MEAICERPLIPLAETSARPPRAARLAVAMLFFLNGAIFATWVSRIPAIQAARALSHGTLGVALLAMAFGALVAMPLAGMATARFGSHRVTQLTAAIYCAILPLPLFAPNFALFVVALFVFGAAHGALDVGMNAQAVAVEERYRRPIMSSLHALFSVGGLVGAGFGGVVAAAGFPPLLHFAAAAMLLGGATALLAFPRLLDARETETLDLPDELASRPRFALPPRSLLVLGVIAFCTMVGEGAMADWTGVFLRNVAGSSEAVAAAGYAAFSVAMAAGRFGGDGLTVHLGPVTIVRISGVLAAAGLALALLFGQSVPALIGFAAVGAGFATVVPQVFSAAGRTTGMSSGAALATVSTLGYFGFLLGPPAIGFLAEAVGLRAALGVIVLTSALLIVLAPSVRRPPTT
jgi:predicted MFS family arabinose efflux permease